MGEDTFYKQVDQAVVKDFESLWLKDTPTPIEEAIQRSDESHRLATLVELVHIEMEFRWKSETLENFPLENYLARFTELNCPEVLSGLARQEFRLRSEQGESVSSQEYRERFPGLNDYPDEEESRPQAEAPDTAHEMATMVRQADPPLTNDNDNDNDNDKNVSPSTVNKQATILRKAKNGDTQREPPAPDHHDANPGKLMDVENIPGYDLLSELGRGGMGVVYKARDQGLKRLVAIKMILTGTHAGEEEMQRFQVEAEAVARLNHYNIVNIYEVGEHQGKPYIALEYVAGGSLEDRILGKPQPPNESAQMIQTLAYAIHAAHEKDIVHRDLKPANILLDEQGEPRITDFGLAKQMDDDSNQTQMGTVLGTPSYMAPEQADSDPATIGAAVDTYALGAVLYHLLTGRPPFQAATQLDTIMQVIGTEPVPPRKLVPEIPIDLETICLKCLQKEPHRRYPNAQELAEDLRRHQEGEPIAARPASTIERSWKWARRRPMVAGMITVCFLSLVAIIGGGAWYNAQVTRERDYASEQKDLAEKREREADQAREEAEKARQVTRSRMAQSQVIQGIQNLQNGDPATALLWFTSALRLDLGKPDREQLHRQRLAQTLTGAAKPKKVLIHDTPYCDWASYTPDCKQIVCVQEGGIVKIFPADSDAKEITLEAGATVSSISFSNSQKLLATAIFFPGGDPDSYFSVTRLWDLETGKRLKQKFRQSGFTEKVNFHPDGKHLLTANALGEVLVWEIETGEVKVTIDHRRSWELSRHRHYLNSEGSLLLTASTDHSVKGWETMTGKQTSIQLLHDGPVNEVRFGPGDQLIATASDDKSARLWNAHTGLPVCPPLNHSGRVKQVIFDPSGSRLASIDGNHGVRVWDTKTGRPFSNVLQHPTVVQAAVFSPTSQLIATACRDGNVRIWSVATGQLLDPIIPHPGPVAFIDFHADGRHLLTNTKSEGNTGSQTRIWDLAAHQNAPLQLAGNGVDQARYIPGTRLVLVNHVKEGLYVFDPDHSKTTRKNSEIPSRTHHFEFDSTGERFLTMAFGGEIQVWNTETLQPLTQPMKHDKEVEQARFSRDGNWLITTTVDHRVFLWDATTGQAVISPIARQGEVINADSWAKNQLFVFQESRGLAASESEFPVQSWAVQDGSLGPGPINLNYRQLDYGEVTYGELNPAQNRLLVITNSQRNTDAGFQAIVFDNKNQRELYRIPFTERFQGASFSDDGKLLLIYTAHSAAVWDAVSGQQVSTWINSLDINNTARLSPNGLLLATAGRSSDNFGTARVWDAHSGQPITQRMVVTKPITSIDFSNDGCRFLTQGDGRVHLWDLEPTPHTLKEIDALGHFLSNSRLDENVTFRPLSVQEQQQAWTAIQQDLVLNRVATPAQVQTYRKTLFRQAVNEKDLLAIIGHSDLSSAKSMATVLWSRSLAAATLGKYDLAQADLEKLLGRAPDKQCYYSANRLVLLLLKEDMESFHQLSQPLLEKYGDTTDPVMAERLAKTCCLETRSLERTDIRFQLAQRSFLHGKENKFFYWSKLAYGMACYRTGQHQLALEQLKPLATLTLARRSDLMFDKPAKILARFFVAMCYHQLGDTQKAHDEFLAAQQQNQFRGNLQNTLNQIYDWLRCDLAEREAAALITKD